MDQKTIEKVKRLGRQVLKPKPAKQTISRNGKEFPLIVRDMVYVEEGSLSTKQEEFWVSLKTSECALVLVDVWQPDLSTGALYQRRMARTIPLIIEGLEAVRRHGMYVVHDPSMRPEADGIECLEGELYLVTGVGLKDGQKLQFFCQERGIKTLFYVGFATNHCVIDNEAGMREMSARGFDCILIRDCTAGVEYPDTADYYGATKVAIDQIEYLYGTSCLSKDLIGGLG